MSLEKTTVPPEPSPARTAETESARAILCRLAHDLRQPLSGIESIAYYLDMVLSDAEPDIGAQCAALRRMVEQASWLIDDAMLAARLDGVSLAACDLVPILVEIGATMALHEERNIELDLTAGPTAALLPQGLARKFVDHLLSFYRGVARAEDPIRVRLSCSGPLVALDFSAAVDTPAEDLPRLLDPESNSGGVRRFLERCGGSLATSAAEETFSIRLEFSAADQAA
jgi:hypothetical protein